MNNPSAPPQKPHKPPQGSPLADTQGKPQKRPSHTLSASQAQALADHGARQQERHDEAIEARRFICAQCGDVIEDTHYRADPNETVCESCHTEWMMERLNSGETLTTQGVTQ